jgi:hypothetical protein
MTTSIRDIDIVPIAVLPAAVAAAPAVVMAIERRRIPSARLRRVLSRRHRGLAPSHLLYSSSSMASTTANATVDAVP